MDLRQLRYFVGIVQAGSLSRAADRLHVAQSAISHHLASLESELEKQLVTRGPKGILLTEAGNVLYRHAEVILRHVEQAKLDATGASANPALSHRRQQFAPTRAADQRPPRHRRAVHRPSRARPCRRIVAPGGALLCDGGSGSLADRGRRSGATAATVARSRQRQPTRRPASVRATRTNRHADWRN